VSVTPYDPLLASGLGRWARAETIIDDQAAGHRYAIYQAAANPALLSGWDADTSVTFGDRLLLRLLEPIPNTAQPGDTLTITLGVRRLQAVDHPYHVFLHLYGDPTPYEGGPLWSQTDARLCDSYPAPRWTDHEIIVQTYVLPVPVDTPPGGYTIVLGLYEPISGNRLLPTSPAGQVDYFEAGRVTITHP
jgi:hypothetical protein